jgi:hypothetical protein
MFDFQNKSKSIEAEKLAFATEFGHLRWNDESNLQRIVGERPSANQKSEQSFLSTAKRTQVQLPDGSVEEKVCDLFGRPSLIQITKPDGSWTREEIGYADENGKASPFVARKTIMESSGDITEIEYSRHGRIASKRQYTRE